MTSITTPASKKNTVLVRSDNFTPEFGSPSPPLPTGPRVVPGNTEDEEEVGIPVEVEGVPVLGIPEVGFPVDGVPVDGKPLVGVPVVGVPLFGVPVDGVPLELQK